MRTVLGGHLSSHLLRSKEVMKVAVEASSTGRDMTAHVANLNRTVVDHFRLVSFHSRAHRNNHP